MSRPLIESDVDPDPLVQFGAWFDEATPVVAAPEAMALATVDDDGRPSARMVLCKAFGPDGFVFFTNLDSRKGRALAARPVAALLFYWEPLARQVRIEGRVELLDPAESDAYFVSRPRGSQISAYASHQSRPVASRAVLDDRAGQVTRTFEHHDVPRPPWWGGIRVVPDTYELWQHRDDRMHDRLRYERTDQVRRSRAGWRIIRLQP